MTKDRPLLEPVRDNKPLSKEDTQKLEDAAAEATRRLVELMQQSIATVAERSNRSTILGALALVTKRLDSIRTSFEHHAEEERLTVRKQYLTTAAERLRSPFG